MTLAWPLSASGQVTQPIVTSGTSLPSPLARLVDEALVRFTIGPEADEADEERELRRAERAVLELLATEGYFEPTLSFESVDTSLIPPRPRLYGLVGAEVIEEVWKERQAKHAGNGAPARAGAAAMATS